MSSSLKTFSDPPTTTTTSSSTSTSSLLLSLSIISISAYLYTHLSPTPSPTSILTQSKKCRKPFLPKSPNLTPCPSIPTLLLSPPPPNPLHQTKSKQHSFTFQKAASNLTHSDLLMLRSNFYPRSMALNHSNESKSDKLLTGGLVILTGSGCYLHHYTQPECSSDKNDTDTDDVVTYLDCRNNVATCGHNNPVISETVAEQVKTMNTNSRYLNPYSVMLCETLGRSMPWNGLIDLRLYGSLPGKNEISRENSDEFIVVAPSPINTPSVDEAQTQHKSSPWTVFLLTSGSEATDLAYRLSTTYLNSPNVITYRTSYHGATMGSIKVSPYKSGKYLPFYGQFQKQKQPDKKSAKSEDDETPPYLWNNDKEVYVLDPPSSHSHTFPSKPDLEPYTSDELCELYLTELHNAIDSFSIANGGNGKPVTLFFEIGSSVGGVSFPPLGYLEGACKLIRSHGGLVVFDEVQSCCGRLGGDSIWGYETLAKDMEKDKEGEGELLVPDIICAGKPLGNGISLATTICRRDIVNSSYKEIQDLNKGTTATKDNENNNKNDKKNNKNFSTIEYFNTFGGNPVSALAGLCVVETLLGGDPFTLTNGKYPKSPNFNQGLLCKANSVSVLLKTKLDNLKSRYLTQITSIRGRGLFYGIQFSSSSLCNSLADVMLKVYRVIVTVDGEGDDCLVFKPPLVFGEVEVGYLIWCLGEGIEGLIKEPLM